MIKKIGDYLANRLLLTAILTLILAFLPFVGWLSTVLAVFIILRNGWQQGIVIVLCSVVPEISQLVIIKDNFALIGLLTSGVFIWLMALTLRCTRSWTRVAEATTAIALVAVLSVHLVLVDMVAWWQDYFNQWIVMVNHYLAKLQLGHAILAIVAGGDSQSHQEMLPEFFAQLQQTGMVTTVAMLMTGAVTTLLLLSSLVNIGLGRWWQLACEPGKTLASELTTIRLHCSFAVTLVLCVVLAMSDIAPIFWDMAIILCISFFFVGFIRLHRWLALVRWRLLLLLIIYGLLVVYPLYAAASFIGLAAMDSLLNIERISQKLIFKK